MKWFSAFQPTEEVSARRIAELTASRRAVADAYEIERQRIERDLHDGAQQFLVSAMIKLGEAQLDASGPQVELIAAAKADVAEGLSALRKTVRGIQPQVLTDRGLVAALSNVATSYGPHVTVYAPHELPELSASVLAAGYFFTTEALTNAAKYASRAPVSVLITSDESLRISVVDQGPGGATLIDGHGLAGMRERLAAFDATLTISSPVGGPTKVAAAIPLLLDRGQPGYRLEHP
ncbi:histidine kinase [Corynebacterium sp. H128]|uniref:sensor histidine kinase n=1 Tax=Corynebacterium sp. H128 TaxID=3133427 RepID=UPI00309DADC5